MALFYASYTNVAFNTASQDNVIRTGPCLNTQ